MKSNFSNFQSNLLIDSLSFQKYLPNFDTFSGDYKELKSIYDADIEFVDERLTTFEAREILKDEKHDNVDAHAAKILIDNWFDINREKNI